MYIYIYIYVCNLFPRVYVVFTYVIGVHACLSKPCQHGGECFYTQREFICVCKGYYVGATCSGTYFTIIRVSVFWPFLTNTHERINVRTAARTHAHIHVYIKIQIISDCAMRDDFVMTISVT